MRRGIPSAFTVDVERDWAGRCTRGVREALPELLDLLDRRRVPATFFVVGELAETVRALLDPAGPHEVGSHGLTHIRLARRPLDVVRSELRGSRDALARVGYAPAGFRAPFLAAPPGLGAELVAAGYTYDASGGRLHPFARERTAAGALPEVALSSLRGVRVPFSLTSLRLLGPIVLALAPRDRAVFLCHLHELLEATAGWEALPGPLRGLHRRGSGRPALALLDALLRLPEHRWMRARALAEDDA